MVWNGDQDEVMKTSVIMNPSATLTREEVFSLLRVGRTKGYELLKRADFPLAVDLSGNGGTLQIFFAAEILAWLEKQPRRNVGAEPEPLAAGRRQYRGGKPILARTKPLRGGNNVNEPRQVADAVSVKAAYESASLRRPLSANCGHYRHCRAYPESLSRL